ncbi:MAG: CbtA family protein [Salaquimonas sp.]
MLIRVLLAAIFAGVLAGVFATAVQSYRVIPLILEAERYEGEGEIAGHSHSSTPASEDSAVSSEEETWAPGGGGERLFYTGLTNIVVGVAFSLILTAAVLFLNQGMSMKAGLIWGLAGFVVFVLAPNFGLPPELPGMQAAEVLPRQIWWLATVVLTATGLGLFAFKQGIVWMILGLVLITAPHLYGAPQPISHESLVPANLAAEFVVATIVASLLFWVFLGGVLGALFEKAMAKEEQSR